MTDKISTMNLNGKILILPFLLLFFIFLNGSVAAETMTFPANTPVWKDAALGDTQTSVLVQPITEEIEDIRFNFIQNSVLYREVPTYRVTINRQQVWLTPIFRAVNGKIRAIDPDRILHLSVMSGLLLLGILLVFSYYRKNDRQEKLEQEGYRAWLPLVVALWTFQFAWRYYLMAKYPGMYQSPTDEGEYFRIARALLHGDFSKPFQYTLGYPLFCIPFLLLNPGINDIMLSQQITQFSFGVMTPINLSLFFLLLFRLGLSAGKSFWAIMFWLVSSKLVLMVEIPDQRILFSPLGLYHSEYIFLAYQFCLTGFNSLSEWSSQFLLLCTALTALCWRNGVKKYPMVGLLFGLACLVRLNNIFWAPLIAYLFWLCERNRLIDLQYLIRAALLAATGFVAVIALQLAVNRLQLGHFLTFPHSLHPNESGKGFQFLLMGQSGKYYCRVIAWPLCLTLPALATITNPKIRNGLILWVVPMLLFFCGFAIVGQHYRFLLPLFYGMTAAIVASEFWSKADWKKRTVTIVFLLSAVIPTLPFIWMFPTPAVLENSHIMSHFLMAFRTVVFLALLPVTLWWWRREWRAMAFLLLVTILVLTDSPWINLTLMAGLLIYAAVSIATDYRRALREGKQAS